MSYTCISFLVLTLSLSITEGNEHVSVTCDAGKFIGSVNTVQALTTIYKHNKNKLNQFLGIPYAEAPVGDRRFQKPVRKARLAEPYQATAYKPSCYGLNMAMEGKRKPGQNYEQSEDCLFLNMFAPIIDKGEKYPVMMYIHGGGFNVGSPTTYPGDLLSVYGEVVVVSITYRLNVWGFLSTGDDASPGNYGLWDQQMAIQWIHDNIAAFGGDPERLTIFGYSAGSASVVYQALYPGNAGLFKGVIAQSGSISCPWSFNSNPLKAAKKIGRLLGCNMEDTRSLVSCIKSKPAEDIVTATNEDDPFLIFPMEFVSVVDGDFIKHPPNELLDHTSSTGIEERRLLSSYDFMTGVVENEGLMMIMSFVGVHGTEQYTINKDEFIHREIPKIAKIMFGDDASKVVEDLIINEYFPFDDPDNATKVREAFLRLSSDYVFKIQAAKTAQIHALSENKKTFYYEFIAMPSQHLLMTPSWATTPNHCDDLTFLFGYDSDSGYTSWTMPYIEDPPEDWEVKLSKAYITMLTNFAKSGNPNTPIDVTWYTKGVWSQYTSTNQETFRFTRDTRPYQSTGAYPSAKAYNFWYKTLPSVIKATKNIEGQEYCPKPGP